MHANLALRVLIFEWPDTTTTKAQVCYRYHSDQASKLHILYNKALEEVERLKEVVDPGIAMVEKSLQYVFSHSARPVVIPGAKSAAQARANAAAGKVELAAVERAALQI